MKSSRSAAGSLMETQARLETQQAELEQTNVHLEEYTQHLERQKTELVRAQKELEANALALERASQYKSEFLANMSHELRTPLNSSLILAKLLQDNKHGNLSDEQVRYAATIHSSNSDLLSLINDILDLSKVEAGQMDVQFAPVAIDGMLQSLRQSFAPIADSKRLKFVTERAEGVPEYFVTDNQRLQQVLRNLLSNAFKFTEHGQVTVSVHKAEQRGKRVALRCARYRHRHCARQAGPHFPGVPASRWHDQPQVRRQRTGFVDIAGILAIAGRFSERIERAGQGQRVFGHAAAEPFVKARSRRSSM